MRKDTRISIRTSREMHDRLKDRANVHGSDNLSLEARLILEKALGIKRVKAN
jgi:hypothetical protein